MLKSRRIRQGGLFAAVLTAVACSGGPEALETPDAVRLELCEFGIEGTDNFVLSHIKYTGANLNGDINIQDYKAKGIESIASAIAVPRNKSYKAEVRRDCYDEKKKVYFPCRVTAEVDLRDIRGMARASTILDAQRYAVFNCQQLTITRSAEALKRRLTESNELLCQVVESGWCDIAQAAGAAATE